MRIHVSSLATPVVPRTRRALAALATCALLLGSASSPAPAEPELRAFRLAGTDLMIDYPAEWWPGGTMGYGVLLSVIGRNEGFPNFSVLTDPEFRPDPDTSQRQSDGYVEDLFRQVLAGEQDSTVDRAEWVEINGLRVYSSLTSWSTVAGRLRARRLIFAHEGIPYIFTWIELDAAFPAIDELVERSVASLRIAPPAAPRGVIG